MKVGISAISTTNKEPKYFPVTSCQRLSGLVCNISNVPLLNSSAKLRMVMAGISNNMIQGANSKNLSSVANPKSRMFVSGNTNRNRPFSKRNTMMAIYPVRLLKNCRNSFLQTDHMGTKISDYRYI